MKTLSTMYVRPKMMTADSELTKQLFSHTLLKNWNKLE